jgi:hypothetical protein
MFIISLRYSCSARRLVFSLVSQDQRKVVQAGQHIRILDAKLFLSYLRRNFSGLTLLFSCHN